MTTKPKVKRFRIKRSGSVQPDADGAQEQKRPLAPQGASAAPQEDGFDSKPFSTARRPKPTDEAQSGRISEEIDAIRNEGLTARQLRMARRLAHKHGLAPTSDFDAVRLLRKAGIDPPAKGTTPGVGPVASRHPSNSKRDNW